jgi:hypothetical protein
LLEVDFQKLDQAYELLMKQSEEESIWGALDDPSVLADISQGSDNISESSI